jgi:hypothetical protein
MKVFPMHPPVSEPDVAGLTTSNGPPTLSGEPPSTSQPSVRRFGRYELIEEVAHGGMGVVYRARDTVLGRIVALKMIRAGLFATADEVARFYREAQAIATLEHRHIIKIYEVGHLEGQHYFTMPFAAGGSVAGYRQRGGADPGVVVGLVEKIARAVQHAHEQGILHRDLKPGNVLLDDQGEPMVADFGLAKFLAADIELTQTEQRPGTVPYMAPEQLTEPPGPATAQTDVWSLGVMFYELLTGQRPFGGGSREAVTRAILHRQPPPPRTTRPHLDRTLESIVLKCLAKNPGHRYPSAAAVADDLQGWSQGRRLPAERWPARAGRTVRRNWMILLAVLTAAVALGLGAGFVAKGPPAEEPPLILIGEVGQPRDAIWRLGQDQAEAGQNEAEGVFFVTGRKTAILELSPGSPWPSYRFEAEVRQDQDLGYGTVGLCFGYEQTSGDAMQSRYAKLHFADPDAGRCIVQVNAYYAAWRGLEQMRGANWSAKVKNHGPGIPGLWRRLAIEVTPEAIRTSFEGDLVIEFPRDYWLKEFGELGRDFRALAPATYPPPGGLGLFVERSKASFRHVLVRPLLGGR